LRASASGRLVPVIIFTSKDLSDEERVRLRALAQRTVLKSLGQANLLQELEMIMPRHNGVSQAAGEPAVPSVKEHAHGR
jgi:DNA-binding response OmpR family regulator